ncbi:LppU/SCO3897 family protein [Nocardia arizonensis]|uniref:LppU/SCO3897 family protein n=1 Tax=Nocardia arizonensis TaxID=1141647 RepID=UPI0006CF9BE5|nr:hypothetical protein [Nocardia arizonensis]
MSTPPHRPQRVHPEYPVEPVAEFDDFGSAPEEESGGEGTTAAVLKFLGVFVVIGIAIVVARGYFGTGSAQADIGRCAKLSGSTAEAEIVFRDCGDAEANYVVAQRLEGADAACASGDYAGYYQSGGDGFTLCLRLNVTEGDCVNGTLAGASMRVNCTAAADFEVERIVRGTADRAACGAAATAENTLVYPKPEPMTLCLARPH